MKRSVFLFVTISCTLLAGCFDTTEEISINKDGTGLFSNTIDLSKMMAMIKQMGGDEVQKLEDKDTIISLAGFADSIAGLTPEQRNIVNRGKMNVKLNIKNEKMVIKLDFPFNNLSEVQMLKEVLPRVSVATLRRMPGAKQMPDGADSDKDSTKLKTFDSYFDQTISKKLISKTLNKEKYATAADDEFMKSLQQMSGMGGPMTVNYIFNLPKKAKKVEGKAAKLSGDKKKVTISVTSDDFFDDPSKFEYRIEY